MSDIQTTRILVDNIKERFHFQESKVYLKEKYLPRLTTLHNGGKFTVTTELLAYLRTTPTDKAVLLDDYSNPISVRVKDLLYAAEEVYTTVMLEWNAELQALSTKR
jgi:hypothetical protein